MERQIDVLIVDDQIKTRKGLKGLLRFTPLIEKIWEAQNGEDAMKIVSEVKPEVVLMDIKMPVMDGLEATRQIKQFWPEVKVIILTLFPSYRQEAFEAGADYFLIKGDQNNTVQDVITSFFPVEAPSSEK